MANTPLAGHPVFAAGILDGVRLLEADAGTGKTWTITGLVVRALIEKELDLAQILVVTFTNAAAAELSERIRLRIAQLLQVLEERLAAAAPPAAAPVTAAEGGPAHASCGPGGRAEAAALVDDPFCHEYVARLDAPAARRARDRLRVALAGIDELAVHTIHAWCQRIIDEHSLAIGVPRGLPIGPGDRERVGRRVADWWRREVLAAPLAHLSLFVLAGVDPERLAAGVEAMVAHPLAEVRPAAIDWRALALRAADARAALVGAVRADDGALLAWMDQPGHVSGHKFRKDVRPKRFAALRQFCALPAAQLPRQAVEFFSTPRFDRAVPGSPIPAACDALLQIDAEAAALRASATAEIAASLRGTRTADLARAGSLAFDDLLRLVHEALVDPVAGGALARALRARQPVAFVDECQDTDPLQWDILHRVYAGGGRRDGAGALVLVGDPKQAIYSFRGADVHAWLSAHRHADCVLRLDENQRSHPGLIEAVNALFDVPDPFRIGEIGFSPAAPGVRSREQLVAADFAAGTTRAPMTVVLLEAGGEQAKLLAPQAQWQATQACVAEIVRLLESGVRLGARALQPADIAVLVRTRRQGGQIKRALARVGIGAAGISRDSVLDTLESIELMRVVAAIDDCADPGRLRSALLTTLLGHDAATLAELETDPARVAALTTRFVEARARWLGHGPIAALRPLLHAFACGPRLAGLTDGERRLTDVHHLIALLADDDAARAEPGLALDAWARLRTRTDLADDDSRELRLESDENLVRILTVHKSKGLEFPVVFVPFAWSGKKAAAPDPCVVHERDGAGGWRAVLDLAPDEPVRDAAAAEAEIEKLRTLYVALTRAGQRCYLFWGATGTSAHQPLKWLLHDAVPGGGAAPAEMDPVGVRAAVHGWRIRADARYPGAVAIVDAAEMARTVRRFEGMNAGSEEAPAGSQDAGTAESARSRHIGTASRLAARTDAVAVPAAAVTTSFSALAAAWSGADELPAQAWPNADVIDPVTVRGDDTGPDRDSPDRFPPAFPAGPLAGAQAADASGSIRFRFPAGPQAGVCLHGILEEAAFDAPLDREIVGRWLARCGYGQIDALAVADWIDEVVRAPLPAPDGSRLALARVPRRRQAREFEFQLEGRQVDERELLRLAGLPVSGSAAGGQRAPAAPGRCWSGFLRGFIDLVFEHAGRWYIVDWKSNFLGTDVQSYQTARLDAEMQRHAYPLQACLYTLAVHRWLRRTVPGYAYETGFGGVFYVFLRGAGTPAAAGAPDARAASGMAPGIHVSRPQPQQIDRLDALFGRSGAR